MKTSTDSEQRTVRLGLRENVAQFSLLVGVNALVGGMIGQQDTQSEVKQRASWLLKPIWTLCVSSLSVFSLPHIK